MSNNTSNKVLPGHCYRIFVTLFALDYVCAFIKFIGRGGWTQDYTITRGNDWAHMATYKCTWEGWVTNPRKPRNKVVSAIIFLAKSETISKSKCLIIRVTKYYLAIVFVTIFALDYVCAFIKFIGRGGWTQDYTITRGNDWAHMATYKCTWDGWVTYTGEKVVPKIVCEAFIKKTFIGKFFNRKIYKHMYIVASVLASCYPEVPRDSPYTYYMSGTYVLRL